MSLMVISIGVGSISARFSVKFVVSCILKPSLAVFTNISFLKNRIVE